MGISQGHDKHNKGCKLVSCDSVLCGSHYKGVHGNYIINVSIIFTRISAPFIVFSVTHYL